LLRVVTCGEVRRHPGSGAELPLPLRLAAPHQRWCE
jgi:hypothetical protein